jgi:UDP-GlcNAc:undecaprenyl-phosphate GlcNAc-1-phosphate transferase
LSLVTLVGALTSVALKNEFVAILSGVVVVVILIATRLFGFAEFVLVRNHLVSSAEFYLSRGKCRGPWRFEIHLEGTANWNRLWRELMSCALEQNLLSLSLDVNAPAIQETYLARWRFDLPHTDEFDLWRAQLPLVAGGRTIGKIEMVGRRDGGVTSTKISTLAKIVENMEFIVANDTASKSVVAEFTGETINKSRAEDADIAPGSATEQQRALRKRRSYYASSRQLCDPAVPVRLGKQESSP